jgi:hypothetical protein
VDREDLEADEQAAPPRGELHAELHRGHELDRDLAHELGRPTPLRSAVASRVERLQEGVVGLLRALERFDPDRGVPFWGYASWWVRQAM